MKSTIFACACVVFLSVISQAYAGQATPFTADQMKLPGKKGVCFTLRQAGDKAGGTVDQNMPRVKALNASWNYSWGATRVTEQPAGMEFVPMIWSCSSQEKLQQQLASEVVPQIKAGKCKRLLGFNEPDRHDQANMPYIKAIELWPALEKLGVPLCSPACADPESRNDAGATGVPASWMSDFMKEADKRGHRIDYIGVHWYGGTNAEAFKAKLKRIHEKYGKRPLLITEFAVADWKTGGNIKKNRHSQAAVLTFMKEIIPWIEQQEWIAGYAWFSFKIDAPQGTSSALFNEAGNLTACGKYYKSVTPGNPKGDQTIKPDAAKKKGN